MSDKIRFQQAQTLIERYKETYKQRYKRDPVFNVVQAKWSLVEIIKDISWEEASVLLEHFFRTTGSHEFTRFVNEYHELNAMRKLQLADAERRRRLLAQPLS